MRDPITTVVEITDTHIKLLQATPVHGVVTVTYCDTKEIAQQSEPEISKTLSGMFAAAKIRPVNLVGVIPRRFAILRPVSLPSHNDHEIKKMINLQVVKQVPYPKEDVQLDYFVLSKQPNGYAKALVIAVHKEVGSRYLKIFQDAGLNVGKLTLSSIGLLQWFNFEENKVGPKHTLPVAVINIDSVSSEICFCHQQKLLFSRSFSFGAKDLNADNITAFVEEIWLTIATYTKEEIGEDITKIVIVSPLNDVSLLKSRLETDYKLIVDTYNPFDNMAQKKGLSLPPLERMGVSCAVNIGLGLTGIKSLMDLMPVEVSDTRKIKHQRREWLKFAALFVLTVILAFSVLGMKSYKSFIYLRQLQKRIDEIEPRANKVKESMRRLEFIKARLNPTVTALDIIRELYRLTPEDISFNIVHLDENGFFLLQGVSQTGVGVNNFQKNLVSSPLFKEVALQYVTKRKIFKGELTDFKMTCQVTKMQEKTP